MIKCVYHRNCFDGFTAAWVVWNYFKGSAGESVEFIPASYGDAPPKVKKHDMVYIVDFSYSRAVLEELAETCNIRVLDHHKTAQENLAGMSPTLVTFDMNKSGAMLAWEHFNPDKEAPLMVQYVQDRDLWTWQLLDSKEISAALHLVDKDFEAYEYFAHRLQTNLYGVKKEGIVVLKTQEQAIKMMNGNFFHAKIAGQIVPAVNLSCFMSEAAHNLLDMCPDAPFVAYFYVNKNGREYWGLRSNGKEDVSKVARVYGGGGHPNAAGFEVEFGDIEVMRRQEEELVNG